VERKLKTNLENTLVFVQLLQRASFEWRDRNFCHFEFEEALKSRGCKKMLFVLGDERDRLVKMENDVAATYTEWYKRAIVEKDAMQLKPTLLYDDTVMYENTKKIQAIADRIEEAKTSILEDIPLD
jgi:hypothetical protein